MYNITDSLTTLTHEQLTKCILHFVKSFLLLISFVEDDTQVEDVLDEECK